MKLMFEDTGWEEYLYWQQNDKKMLKKINDLIKDARRNPYEGIGLPEPLKHNFSGCWSRRITIEHRLVYKVEQDQIIIMACRHHY